MTGKQLKNSILQWAIQGKLVPQDPNDEPASVLLERIREEKARLIKEKKIKKDKNESIIYRGDDNSHYEKILATGEVKCIDDEIPFEIPENWAWVRYREIANCLLGKTKNPHQLSGTICPYLCSINVYWGKIKLSEIKEMLFSDTDMRQYSVHKGDMLICEGGEAGRTAIYNGEIEPMYFQNALHRVRFYGNISAHFYLHQMEFYKKTGLLNDHIKGETIQHFVLGKLQNLIVPLPPVAEQQRIVEKLETLLPLVEQFTSDQTKLDTLNNEISALLKKSILQEAIQGKLVSLDSNDEPASLLLDRIREEKKKLVACGKLKKKDLTDSTIFKGDDNKYYEQIDGKAIEIDSDFEFPNTWSVVRLSDICRLIDGEKKQGQYVCLDAKYLRGKSTGDKLNNGKFVSKGDNIILVDGENSGEVFTVPCDGYMGSTFKQLWVSREMYLPYVLYFIQFYKDRLRNSKKGAAIPHLNKDIFYNLLIGIPPKQEQKCISDKITILNKNL